MSFNENWYTKNRKENNDWFIHTNKIELEDIQQLFFFLLSEKKTLNEINSVC